MSYQDYLNDKLYKHQQTQSGESNCCQAPVIQELELCSECYCTCEDVTLEPELCRGCGDVEIDLETDGLCCSNDCWNLYKSETFDDD